MYTVAKSATGFAA